MKLLSLPLLLCALLALSKAAENEKETPAPEEAAVSGMGESGKNVVKRASSCPGGWTYHGSRCYLYVSASYTWSEAETYCLSQGGNLASVLSSTENEWLKNYIYSKTHTYPLTWIGGSDAEQESYWFWSDGSRFSYKNWCSGMPRTTSSYNCILINYSDCRCWLDYPCSYRFPFVCVRK